jgi:translation initiation factor IF-2
VSPPDPESRANALTPATSRATARLVRAIAIAATLLIGTLGAAPAWGADDTGAAATTIDSTSSSDGGTGAIDPPPNPIDTSAPAVGGSPGGASGAPSAQDPPPAASDPTPPASSDQSPATPSPADDQSADDKSPKRSPANGAGSDASGTPSSSSSATTSTPTGTPPGAQPASATITLPPGADGYPGDWGGQDSFLLAAAPRDDSGGSGSTGYHSRFSGLFAFAATRATRIEAKERRGHQTAKVSALGGGAPGGGGGLPHNNPFFNLLSGPGGAGGSLMLISLLAVLGASIALPRELSKAFQTPKAPWRPLAYVPPIELPG